MGSNYAGGTWCHSSGNCLISIHTDGSVVKNQPASAGDARDMASTSESCQEDPLEKEMAAHSSILAWNIPWTEEPGRLQSIRSQRA